ncbi:hypothetical protein B484DRAFT_454675 [Ochromonadaceae sp. CCMP2298]|nr:hypothetical protein B484DRAFT_454675 [Ochromonadaceae sp. CCMP2298]
MGGGRKYPYPKWVWSPSGGWWPSNANWKRNTAIYMGVVAIISVNAYMFSSKHMVSEESRRGGEGGSTHSLALHWTVATPAQCIFPTCWLC